MRAYQRYVLLQIPGLIFVTIAVIAAARAFDLSGWIIPAALGVWLAKEVALYPLLKKSVLRRDDGVDRLVGTGAVVTQALEPEGWVRAGGELWRARAESGSIAAGSDVRVVHVDRLVLIVAERE